MSESIALIVVACITSFATLGLGIATLLQGRKTQEQGVKTHDTFNSRMDLLLKLTKDAAIAEGKELERDRIEKEVKALAVARLEVEAELKLHPPPPTIPRRLRRALTKLVDPTSPTGV